MRFRAAHTFDMSPSGVEPRVPIWIGIKLAKLASGIKLAIPVSRSVLNLHPVADPRISILDVPATPYHHTYRFVYINLYYWCVPVPSQAPLVFPLKK